MARLSNKAARGLARRTHARLHAAAQQSADNVLRSICEWCSAEFSYTVKRTTGVPRQWCCPSHHAMVLERRKGHDEDRRQRRRATQNARLRARWLADEPYRDRELARNEQRRAARYGAESVPVDRRDIWTRDRGICHLCGTKADPSAWDLDHIVPLSHGGHHAPANVAVSHPRCNRSKGDRAVGEQLRLVG